jgi:hypothetical protein
MGHNADKIHRSTASTTFHESMEVLQHRTGVVIPVYLPDGVDAVQGEALLQDTVTSYCAQVAEPSNICLSVDGENFGARVARQLAAEFRTSCAVAPTNRGKLQGAVNGTRLLLEKPALAYVAIVDQDGDHFANELLNFIRAAEHIVDQTGDDRLMMLGRRISLHRPLGFLRGELELFADYVLMQALSYFAVVNQQPLRLEYAMVLDNVPDFHSGYKVFSRVTAEHVFLSEPQQAGVEDDCYYRHACEAVMAVEAMVHNARLGVVNRTTFNEQPISTFGLFDRSQLMADTIIWPCKRLAIPPSFVKQWMADYMPRLRLNTLTPVGKEELHRVQALVIAALSDAESAIRPTPELQPLFV